MFSIGFPGCFDGIHLLPPLASAPFFTAVFFWQSRGSNWRRDLLHSVLQLRIHLVRFHSIGSVMVDLWLENSRSMWLFVLSSSSRPFAPRQRQALAL